MSNDVVATALSRGYTLDEVADIMSKQHGLDANEIRARGYTSDEIIQKFGYTVPAPEKPGLLSRAASFVSDAYAGMDVSPMEEQLGSPGAEGAPKATFDNARAQTLDGMRSAFDSVKSFVTGGAPQYGKTMQDYEAPPASLIGYRGAPVEQKAFDELKAQYEMASPEEREKMVAEAGVKGNVWRALDERYKEDNYALDSTAEFDPRREAQERRIRLDVGADSDVARNMVSTGLRAEDAAVAQESPADREIVDYARDTANQAMRNVPQTAKMVVDVARLPGDMIPLVGEALTVLSEELGGQVESMAGSVSPQLREKALRMNELAQSGDTRELIRLLSANPDLLAEVAIPSLGAMFVIGGVGGAAGKATAASMRAERAGQSLFARSSSSAFNKLVASRSADSATRAALGANVGLVAGSAFDSTDGPQEAKYLAATVAGLAALAGGKLTGGGAEGALARSFSGSGAGRLAVAVPSVALREGGQEYIEEGGEAIGVQTGEVYAGTRDGFNLPAAHGQGIIGAAAGMAIGGGVGAFSAGTPAPQAPSPRTRTTVVPPINSERDANGVVKVITPEQIDAAAASAPTNLNVDQDALLAQANRATGNEVQPVSVPRMPGLAPGQNEVRGTMDVEAGPRETAESLLARMRRWNPNRQENTDGAQASQAEQAQQGATDEEVVAADIAPPPAPPAPLSTQTPANAGVSVSEGQVERAPFNVRTPDGQQTVPVWSLEEARDKTQAFLQQSGVTADQFGAGVQVFDQNTGLPVARINYAGEIIPTETREQAQARSERAVQNAAAPQITLTASGKPFASERSAATSAKARKLDLVPVQVEGGWGLAPKQVEQATEQAPVQPTADDWRITINYGGSNLSVALPKSALEMTASEVEQAVRDQGLEGWKDGTLKMYLDKHREMLAGAVQNGQSVSDSALANSPGLVRPDLNDDQLDLMADDLAGIEGAARTEAMRAWGKPGDVATTSPFKVFYNDDNGVLWGIPYAMRQGQQPKDIKPEFRKDWVRLSGAKWVGNQALMPAEQQAMEQRLARGEWIEAPQQAQSQGAGGPETFITAPTRTEWKANSDWFVQGMEAEDNLSGQGPLFSRGATGSPAPRMMAVHNLSADNLLFADRMGGLAVPSVGVISETAGEVEGFGEITLIGTRDLVDPKREQVFSSDAYTARFPKPEWPAAKRKDADRVVAGLRDVAAEFDDRTVLDETFDSMVNRPDAGGVVEAWIRSNAARAKFLREQGIEVAPVMRQIKTSTGLTIEQLRSLESLYDAAEQNENNGQHDTAEHKEIKARIETMLRENYAETGSRDAAVEKMIQRINDKPTFFLYKDFMAIQNGPETVDSWETSRLTDKLLEGKEADFKVWIEAQILPNFGDPFLKIGRRKVPYTLENIVEVMTSAPARGAEKTMTYGPGQVRAASSIEFSDLEQMRAEAAARMATLADYKTAQKRTEQMLDDYRKAVVDFSTLKDWRGDVDTWQAMDAAMRALAKWATGKKRDVAGMRAALKREDFANVPDAVVQQAIDAAEALLTAPVPYFEAKPQRVVGLNEFAGAVVPANTSQAVRDVLERNGIAVREYTGEANRVQAAREFAAELSAQGRETQFSRTQGTLDTPSTPTPVTTLTAAFKQAFPRQAGALDSMIKRGEEGRRGGVVFAEDEAALAQAYADKTGRTLEEAMAALQMSKSARPLPSETLAETGDFKTGQPVTFSFIHNTDSATALFGKPKKGDRFQRDLEPSGRYVVAGEPYANMPAKLTTGKLTFQNPLVIKAENWKQALFDHYGKRGKRLSEALIADGYDGVVTVDSYGTSEILDLTTFDVAKALYSKNGAINGFYDPSSGMVFINQSAVTADTIGGVLLHEAMHGGQNADVDAKAMKLVADRDKPTTPVSLRPFLNAVAARMEAAGVANDPREASAYIVEEAVAYGRRNDFSVLDGKFLDWLDGKMPRLAKFLRDWIAGIRAWGLKHGINLNPTVDDLMAFAQQNMAAMARGEAVQGSGPVSGSRDSVSGMDDDSDYDYDYVLTHESSDPKFTGKLTRGGLFDGVFALMGDKGAAIGPGGNHISYVPRRDKVADNGDRDLDYDKSMAFLRKTFPRANEEQLDMLYEITAEDKEISSLFSEEEFYAFSQGEPHPLQDFLPADMGEASWEAQRIRGQLAVDQGFDAIAMNDENGTSYLIPFGSKAKVLSDSNDPQFSRSSGTPGPGTLAQGGGRPAPRPPTLPEETAARATQRVNQDDMNRFTVIQNWLKDQGMTIDVTNDVWKAEVRMHGIIAVKIEEFRDRRIKPLVEKTQTMKLTTDEMAVWLVAEHAQERNAQIRKVDPMNDAGSGMTDQQARDLLAGKKVTYNGTEYEFGASRRRAAEDLAKEWRAIAEDAKQMRLNAGLLDQSMVDAWEGAYSKYVPLKGTDADGAQSGSGGRLSARVRNARALGHDARDEKVIENLIRDYELAVHQTEKNRVAQTTLKLVLDANNAEIGTVDKPVKRKVLKPGDTAWTVQNASGLVLASFDTQQEARRYIVANRLTGAVPQKVKADPMVAYQASSMLAENEFQVYVKGHAIRVQLNDPLLAQAYNRIGADSLPWILGVGRAINGHLSKVYTGLNPEFLYANIQRDLQFGVIKMTADYGIKAGISNVMKWPSSFYQVLRYRYGGHGSNDLRQYLASGGTTGVGLVSDIERIGSDIQLAYDQYRGAIETFRAERGVKGAMRAAQAATWKLITALTSWIEHMNAAGENAMRLATFRTVRDLTGGDVAEAAVAAKMITTNFNKRGEKGQHIGALYLFFNPAVQSTAAFAESMFYGKHKWQAWGLLAGMAGLGLLARMQFDDDEWEKLNPSDKTRNLLIRTGTDKETGFPEYIKIPIAYGPGFFPQMAQTLYDVDRGLIERDVAAIRLSSAFIEHFGPAINPIGAKENTRWEDVVYSIAPTVPQMIMSPAFNLNDFGGELVPTSMFDEGKPDSQRMNRATKGTVYADFAEWLNVQSGGSKSQKGSIDVSPETLKHWVTSLTGGAGAFVADTYSLGKNYLTGELDPDSTELKDLPFVRKTFGKMDIKDLRRPYYELREKAEAAEQDYRRALKAGETDIAKGILDDQRPMIVLRKLLDAYGAQIKNLRDQQDAIMLNDELTLSQKRAQVRELEGREAMVYRKVEEKVKQYKDRFK